MGWSRGALRLVAGIDRPFTRESVGALALSSVVQSAVATIEPSQSAKVRKPSQLAQVRKPCRLQVFYKHEKQRSGRA
jgi:hypothetical protein